MSNQYGAEIDLIAGSGGIFEVSLDGELIFSKRQLNRFPEENEIAAMILREQR